MDLTPDVWLVLAFAASLLATYALWLADRSRRLRGALLLLALSAFVALLFVRDAMTARTVESARATWAAEGAGTDVPHP